MNSYRKTTSEEMLAARQARVRRENLPLALQLEKRLAELQTFVRQLAKTPHGRADLARRTRLFGHCPSAAGETPRHFYGKLRHWLDRHCEESSAV